MYRNWSSRSPEYDAIKLNGEPALGLWFIEPGPSLEGADQQLQIAEIAGATAARGDGSLRGFPILLERDQMTGEESFLQREMKFSRRWLYAKGIMAPEEERPPVQAALEGFFESCRTGKNQYADLDCGLDNSIAVMLANLAMDEGRQVRFDEFEHLAQMAENQPSG